MSSEEIEQIKEKVFKHPNAGALRIERVPRDILDAFKKYSNDAFVGDYGMALKSLVDKQLIEPLPFAHMYNILEDHESRITKLEGTGAKPNRIIRTISGREIKLRNKE